MILAETDAASIIDSMSIWSIVASIVSMLVGSLAIGLSVTFFLASRKAEQSVKESLVKIETQAAMLRDITEKQLDRLTRYATTRSRSQPTLPDDVTQALAQLPQTITLAVRHGQSSGADSQLLQELVDYYIAVHFYAAQTNFWAQLSLPSADEFDTENELHRITQRIIDLSNGDFRHMETFLTTIDSTLIQNSRVHGLLQETLTHWASYVRSTSDVFIARASQDDDGASESDGEKESS